MARTFEQLNDISTFNNLMAVDSLNLAFKFKHSKTKNYASKYLEMVRSLARSYEANDIIILADYKGSSYRRAIYPDYKANRVEQRKNQTEEEKQEFQEFIEDYNKTLELLEEMGYPVLKYKGVEADDLAAYIVDNKADNYNHIWLISSDKDWDLLINEKTSRFSYVTRKEVTLENWSQHYPYLPEEHISIKVLEGDTGDNVPGVQGIGPKRALGLLKTYGSALDIYDNIPIDQPHKYIQNLNQFKEQILLNYELMDLLTYYKEAIGKENIKDIESKL